MLEKLVLVLNCGSSSLKFAIINVEDEKKYISGIAECLGSSKSVIRWKTEEKERKKTISESSLHKEVIRFISKMLLEEEKELYSKLIAIGHRVVHGGNKFDRSVIIDDDVLRGIKNFTPFAPLHNPINLIGIKESMRFFPSLIKRNVAVFDTAFHQTMPEKSYLYAIPYSFYRDHHIRRYGAHGISHFYVSRKVSELLKKSVKELNLITCHLGNGSSICAIQNGKCVETSMGLTPLEGLVMGTRSGDIDPYVIFYMHDQLKIPIEEIKNILMKRSGLMGLTGISNDCRYIEDNYYRNKNAKLAMDIYCHRLSKYIGSYSILMKERLDALVFTGGIGENSCMVREISLNNLKALGFEIDKDLNLSIRFGKTGKITRENSRLAIVIPTDEELIIAKDSAKLVNLI